ncbi:MAG: hypothetical protein JNM78_13405 [Cyclobacteriaceae bacterium]|nr:hypothetical protein [Cyclobacteriaceae bacterium]
MKFSLAFYLVLICFLNVVISCQDALPEKRPFPILRTLPPKNINSDGATFRAELIADGDSPITAYGFIWDTVEPEFASANKIEVGTDFSMGKFDKRIESLLAKDAVYKVRAYAFQNGKAIYGNTISFTSLGSKASAWGLEAKVTGVMGGFSTEGGSDDQFGYVIFQLGESFRYDPVKKTISSLQNYPAAFNSGSQLAMCTFREQLYVFGSTSNLYKLENNNWSVASPLPFNFGNFGGYYQALSDNDFIYLISTYGSYAYDVANKLWYQFRPVPASNTSSKSGTFYQGKGYLVMYDKTFWELDTATGIWTQKASYPGIFQDRLVGYGHNDKLYFGLNQLSEFWEYDISLNQWQPAERFPGSLKNVGRQFYFVIDSKLYYGINERLGDYTIWGFEPKN